MCAMGTSFVGGRLTEAREARGINQTELADLVGVKRATISHYERGQRAPDESILARLAAALDVPRAFFFLRIEDAGNDILFYRSLASATKTDRKRATRKYSWLKRITSYMRGFVRFPMANLPRFQVPDQLSDVDRDVIGSYAARTRQYWGLGMGPISDMMLLMENNGVIVSKAEFDSKHMDGYSSLDELSGTPYVITSYDKGSAVRSRFDLAHELGHLVLHAGLPRNVVSNPVNNKIIELQANMFAGEFLLPEESFSKDLGVISLDSLRGLKHRWLVSIGAMVHRVQALGWLSDEQATRLWINYSRRGWRTGEPLDDVIELERPRLLPRGFELLIDRGVRNPEQIADELCLSVPDICELAGLDPGVFAKSMGLELLDRPSGRIEATEMYDMGRDYTPRSMN